MQTELFNQKEESVSLEDVFQAYFDCRKNKRNNLDALEFEIDFEKELIRLWREINNETYQVSPLDVFIVDKPVKREIFAAKFRDRIIHHLVINKLEDLFEKEFIYDTYSCRKGKGTHFGIKRINKFIRQCSHNYTKDCYILKLDIKGYFMSINKSILLEKLERFVKEKYKGPDKKKIIWLCRVIIENDPVKNCQRKSAKEKWKDLPPSKSLFWAAKNCGLPIGNYTNQVFANFYLNSFDHFIKHDLGVRYYGRYVDDFVLIFRNEKERARIVFQIEEFLQKELALALHPQKAYFQHYLKGVEFLGVLIKAWRNYIGSRTKNSFGQALEEVNRKIKKKELSGKERDKILAQLNSYLGAIEHVEGYRLKRCFLSKLAFPFWNYFKTNKRLSLFFCLKIA